MALEGMTTGQAVRLEAVRLYHAWVQTVNQNLMASGQGPWIPTTEQYDDGIDRITKYVLDGPESDRPVFGKFTQVRRELEVA